LGAGGGASGGGGGGALVTVMAPGVLTGAVARPVAVFEVLVRPVACVDGVISGAIAAVPAAPVCAPTPAGRSVISGCGPIGSVPGEITRPVASVVEPTGTPPTLPLVPRVGVVGMPVAVEPGGIVGAVMALFALVPSVSVPEFSTLLLVAVPIVAEEELGMAPVGPLPIVDVPEVTPVEVVAPVDVLVPVPVADVPVPAVPEALPLAPPAEPPAPPVCP
jgi:hypothetical protein